MMDQNAQTSIPFSHRLILHLTIVLCCLTVRAQTQPDVRQLVVGENIERIVLRQEIHAYTIDLKRGQVLRVTIQEKGADVGAVIVRMPDQQKVSAAVNFGNGFMRESLTFVAEQDGVFALVTRAQQVTDSNKDGRYELATSVKNLADETDLQRIHAEKLLEEGFRLFMSNDKKNLPLAAAMWEQSLEIWRVLGDKYWAGIAGANTGIAFSKSENYGKAEPYLKEALRLFEEGKNDPEIGAVSSNLAALYAAIQDEERTNIYLNRALSIAMSLGDKRVETLMLALKRIGKPDEDRKAQGYLGELATARARSDKFSEAAVWIKVLFQYVHDDSIDDDKRRALFDRVAREALPLSREIKLREVEMEILLGLGAGYLDLDESDKPTAFNYLTQTLMLASMTGNQMILSMAYLGLNGYYDALDHNKLAIFFGKKGLNAVQDLRQNLKMFDKEIQQNFIRKAEETYGTLASDLAFEGRLMEAHQVINLNRDQEFYDFSQLSNQVFAQLVLSSREAENDRLFAGNVETLVAKYSKRLDTDYQSAIDELRVTLQKLDRNFDVPASERDVVRTVPDTTDMQFALRELSARTGKKHACIYFVDGASTILLITPESIKFFARGNELEQLKELTEVKKMNEGTPAVALEDLDESILEFLKLLRSPALDPRPLGAAIYKRIFTTVDRASGLPNTTLEAELDQYKADVLLWSLAGNLRYVPVAALYDSKKRQYLVEKYQNVVFTRARKERFLAEPKPWVQGLGFGTSFSHKVDFDGRKFDLSSLPGVAIELSTILGNATTKQKGLFSGQVFLNRAFTREALLSITKTKPAFVHIASHFIFQPGDAKNSFLLLGDGSAFSLFDMQDNQKMFEGVDLLTLSACETAAQQAGANGKEVDGFAELAQRLGASSVIATLWKVSDAGTSKLMTEFYRLRQENPTLPKSEILRNAQLNLLNGKSTAEAGARRRGSRGVELVGTADKRSRIPFKPAIESPFEHPYYWAPFVLFGNPR